MSTSTLTAASLTGVRWMAQTGPQAGRVGTYEAQRPGYGVRNERGEWMSWDGDRPYLLRRHADAHEVATTITSLDGLHWLAEVAS